MWNTGARSRSMPRSLDGDVDLGLVAYPVKRSGLQVEIFSEDRLVLICHPNHPLARRASASRSRN